MKRLTIACAGLLLITAGCANQTGLQTKDPGGHLAAAAFVKAAEYVYSRDFTGPDLDKPVEEHFSCEELRVLEQHRPALQSLIETALKLQDSVGGAKLAAHLTLTGTNMPRLIRQRILEPRHCYGWEGYNYDDLESYLADNQYPYSIEYLNAMRALAGKPVRQAISLQPDELRMLQEYAGNEDSEFHHWALWMLRKLSMTERPAPINSTER